MKVPLSCSSSSGRLNNSRHSAFPCFFSYGIYQYTVCVCLRLQSRLSSAGLARRSSCNAETVIPPSPVRPSLRQMRRVRSSHCEKCEEDEEDELPLPSCYMPRGDDGPDYDPDKHVWELPTRYALLGKHVPAEPVSRRHARGRPRTLSNHTTY